MSEIAEINNEESQQSAVAPIIQMIERVALSPDVNIENLERVMAMQERMLDRDQEAEFNRALVVAQSEMPVITKNKKNLQTNSSYSDLTAVNAGIVPVYTKNGFAVSFDTDDSPLDQHIRILALVVHKGGHSKTFKHDLPIDDKGLAGKVNKTTMHGRASTVSYGQRYLLSMIFNVSTGADVDGNEQTKQETLTDEQQANLKALMEEVGADEARFLKYIKVNSISEILGNRYGWAIATLEKKRT